jgi:tetraacyldisaccharide 4'-kinase
VITASSFHDLVSGRRRGPGPGLLRAGLRLVEIPYTWAVSWRNRRYDTRRHIVCQVPVPVVSVGNLTLGGTGKTPLVEWLARWFTERGVRVCVVSRGYGASAGTDNDEARELEARLPGVPQLQNPDRVTAARAAIQERAAQLILLDDGFQHRRLQRDLDLVLIDALQPFGYGHVFPRGLLREPLQGLRRADAVGLTRADLVDAARRRQIFQQVQRVHPAVTWLELAHRPWQMVGAGIPPQPADRLRDVTIAAFCGIGNPAGFRGTLRRSGCRLAAFREFPDHHPYGAADLDELRRWAERLPRDVAAVVCTQKDLVKIGVARLAHLPLCALTVQLEVLRGLERLESLLLPLAEQARAADIDRGGHQPS